MLTPIEIARLEETRQAIGTAEISDEHEHVAGGVMSFAGVGSWANQAAGMGLAGPVTEAEVQRFIDFYTSRGVEPRLELAPFADDTLIAHLSARGFTLREFENVFVRQLDSPAPCEPHAAPPESLELVEVDRNDREQIEIFVDCSTVGFRPEGEPCPEPLATSVRRVCAHERNTNYLAVLDGVPVGGGGMETSDPIEGKRVACLFGASVAPNARKRGIQQALIARRVERAREQNASFVCIHSKPGIPTERNAMRLGFRLAYTKVAMALAGERLTPSP